MDLTKHIEALKKKDQDSFEIIYHDTKRAVYSMIHSKTHDRFLTEDVMQETYIKMVEHIHSYNPKQSFLTWLLTIAKNSAIDALRKKKHEQVFIDKDQEALVEDNSQTSQDRREMEEALSILSDYEKEIVLLKTLGGLKHKEIAQELDKPLGTILWDYNQAIKKVKQFVEGGRR